MAEPNQAIPLAPARVHPTSDEEAQAHKTMNRRRRTKLCVCISTPLLLLVIVIVILAFTVFKVKDPKVTFNEITLTNLNTQLTQFPTPQVRINMTMLIDMSIKNPNVASFRLGNSTTTMYYRGATVADAQIPPGLLMKARKTTELNVTAVIMADRLASNSELLADVMKGEMNMSAYMVVPGRVKILFVKKHVEVRMNCTMKVIISSREIQDLICQRKVKL